jgi:hypothetical protein
MSSAESIKHIQRYHFGTLQFLAVFATEPSAFCSFLKTCKGKSSNCHLARNCIVKAPHWTAQLDKIYIDI